MAEQISAKTDAGAWSGPTGDVWAQEWQRTDRSFADLTKHLNRAIRDAMPNGPIRIADIGCGAGATSIAAATARSEAEVTGFDLSVALVAIARERSSGLRHCRFIAGPVEQTIGSDPAFDLIISRHGVMFFEDPVAGLASIRAAARPEAQLVFSCFRDAGINAWACAIAAAIPGDRPAPSSGYEPGPFAFAEEKFVRDTLHAAGWVDVIARPVDFRYRAGEGPDPVADAVSFFGRIGPAARLLAMALPQDRPAILDAVTQVCKDYREGDCVEFPAAAWIWTARNGN